MVFSRSRPPQTAKNQSFDIWMLLSIFPDVRRSQGPRHLKKLRSNVWCMGEKPWWRESSDVTNFFILQNENRIIGLEQDRASLHSSSTKGKILVIGEMTIRYENNNWTTVEEITESLGRLLRMSRLLRSTFFRVTPIHACSDRGHHTPARHTVTSSRGITRETPENKCNSAWARTQHSLTPWPKT